MGLGWLKRITASKQALAPERLRGINTIYFPQQFSALSVLPPHLTPDLPTYCTPPTPTYLSFDMLLGPSDSLASISSTTSTSSTDSLDDRAWIKLFGTGPAFKGGDPGDLTNFKSTNLPEIRDTPELPSLSRRATEDDLFAPIQMAGPTRSYPAPGVQQGQNVTTRAPTGSPLKRLGTEDMITLIQKNSEGFSEPRPPTLEFSDPSDISDAQDFKRRGPEEGQAVKRLRLGSVSERPAQPVQQPKHPLVSYYAGRSHHPVSHKDHRSKKRQNSSEGQSSSSPVVFNRPVVHSERSKSAKSRAIASSSGASPDPHRPSLRRTGAE